jgi:peptidoglycan glycosyltransferase
MDRQIRRLGIGLVALFGLLFAQLAYVQVVAADRIAENRANAARQIIAEYEVERGQILSRDGTSLARSVPAPERSRYRFLRRYPGGAAFGQLTGYYSLIYGRSGLEQSMNPYLSGDAPELAVSTFADLVLGKPKKGGTVRTTLDTDLQVLAQQLVDDLPNGGAIAAIDPANGDVLALASAPSFDPNRLSTPDEQVARAYWAQLQEDPDKPLISKAFQEVYLPGSTFKMVTAAAAIENGYGPDSVWPNPPELELPQTTATLENFGDEWCLGGASQITLAQAFTVSCNVTFGEIGLELGPEALAAQARGFAFCPTDPTADNRCLEETLSFELPMENGRFPVPSYYAERQGGVAFAATGLDNDLTNPLHEALIAGAIANGGTMFNPRLVTEIRDPSGRVVRGFEPREWDTPISKRTSSDLTQMMLNVVSAGTGTAAQIPGIPVAGKTGTATNGEDEPPNAWFTAFAPAGDPAQRPRIAVSVIVLDGGDLGNEATGGIVAAPIAREVIQAYLQG